MKKKEIFLNIFLLSCLILFIKFFLLNFFSLYIGDIILAFILVILTLVELNIFLIVFLFLLGLTEGLDFVGIGTFLGFYFVLFSILWNKLKNYFNLKSFKTKIVFWFIGISCFLLLRIYFYYSNLNIIIDKKLILYLIKMSFYYLVSTYLWILIIYKFCKNILQTDDKF